MSEQTPEPPEPSEEELRNLLRLSGQSEPEPDLPAGQAGEDDFLSTLESLREHETVEDFLKRLDPADSKTGLALFQWLVDTERLRIIGTLSSGIGYIYQYVEPLGSTKAGHVPGATKRTMDSAVEKVKAAGVTKQIGMCATCMNVVYRAEDGTIVTNDDKKDPHCRKGGVHKIVY
jgi:hypothetical protein